MSDVVIETIPDEQDLSGLERWGAGVAGASHLRPR
jgi:hypothetical protein